MEIPIPNLFRLKQTFYIEKHSSFQIHILPPFRQSCCIALLRKLAPTLCAWIYLVQVDITSIGKLGAQLQLCIVNVTTLTKNEEVYAGCPCLKTLAN